jgi:crotonobetainyl-CoA:carnitine CoA-transferase CaiB-like acyl-CoA transferase
VEEVFSDPQTTARGMVQRVAHATLGEVAVTGVPVKLSGTPGGVRIGPPVLGQHTTAVLTELGYDQAAIDALASAGAIRP